MQFFKLMAYVEDNKDFVSNSDKIIYTYEYKFINNINDGVFLDSEYFSVFLKEASINIPYKYHNLVWRLNLVREDEYVYKASIMFNTYGDRNNVFIARGDVGKTMEENHHDSLFNEQNDFRNLYIFNISGIRDFLSLIQWAILIRNPELILPYAIKDNEYSIDIFQNKYSFTISERNEFRNYLKKIGSNNNYTLAKIEREFLTYSGAYDDGYYNCEDGVGHISEPENIMIQETGRLQRLSDSRLSNVIDKSYENNLKEEEAFPYFDINEIKRLADELSKTVEKIGETLIKGDSDGK